MDVPEILRFALDDKYNISFVIQNGTKCSEESRVHKVGVTEILRFALDDISLYS